MTHNVFHTVPRRKLRDSVLGQLLAAIERGTYPPGSELPSERQLMQDMGVGRPAVREAMMALEQRGLIAIAHGRRARVRTPEPYAAPELARRIALAGTAVLAASVDDLSEARRLYETAMVRLAVERATHAGIVLLKRALADNRRAISSADGYLATDMALHRTIGVLTGNVLCAAVGDALFGWLPRFRIRMVHVEGANLLSYDEHARIVGRIAARDADGAVAEIEGHLARSHSLYQRLEAGAADDHNNARRIDAGSTRRNR